jgi:hypothetical protein
LLHRADREADCNQRTIANGKEARARPVLWFNWTAMVTIPGQRPPNAAALERLTSEPGRCEFFAYKNITIGVWTGQADLAGAKAAERAAAMMAVRYREGRSYVGFLVDGLPGPTPEGAEILTKVLGQRDTLSCIACVIEGSGFWASGLRSMVNNVHRESGASGRLKIATSVAEVAAWLSQKHQEATGVAVSVPELLDALVQARRLGGPG